MKKLIFLSFLLSAGLFSPFALAEIAEDFVAEVARAKILSSGVPEASLKRLTDYIEKNKGTTIRQSVYSCKNAKPENPLRPCEDKMRSPGSKDITVANPRYVISIDFSKPSTEERMYLIDLQSGDVKKFLVSHGRGSGVSRWAFKFSDIKDSKQTSLGLYQTGEIYTGEHGAMIRMYGLERSNDDAYNRDIVVHAADYAKRGTIEIIKKHEKTPYGRLGLSWGCPAVAPDIMQKVLLPIFKTQSVIYDHYHPALMDLAQSGKEVKIDPPKDEPPATGKGGVAKLTEE